MPFETILPLKTTRSSKLTQKQPFFLAAFFQLPTSALRFFNDNDSRWFKKFHSGIWFLYIVVATFLVIALSERNVVIMTSQMSV